MASVYSLEVIFAFPAAMKASKSCLAFAFASASAFSFSKAVLASCAALILAFAAVLSTFKSKAFLYSAMELSKSLAPNLVSPDAINLSKSAFAFAALAASAAFLAFKSLAFANSVLGCCSVGLSLIAASYLVIATSKSSFIKALSASAINLAYSCSLPISAFIMAVISVIFAFGSGSVGCKTEASSYNFLA